MPRVRGTHRNEKWGGSPGRFRGRDRDIVVVRIGPSRYGGRQGFFRGVAGNNSALDFFDQDLVAE